MGSDGIMGPNWHPSKVWQRGPRVRVETLRDGDFFLAMDGQEYTYVRVDGAYRGVHHVVDTRGNGTSFAGCAEVVLL